MVERGQSCQAGFGHLGHTDPGVLAALAGIHVGFCEDLEERGLTDARQSDNSCLHKLKSLAQAHSPACRGEQASRWQTSRVLSYCDSRGWLEVPGKIKGCHEGQSVGERGKAAGVPREVPAIAHCNMNTPTSKLPFELAAAMAHLSAGDPRLAKLIEELAPFEPEIDHTQSPYEALLEAIVYQSISGKAAATILERVKAL